jgi:peptidoglycan hydrolase CwlO-like protein
MKASPKLLVDIKARFDSFSRLPSRLNLSYQKTGFIDYFRSARLIVPLALIFASLFLGSAAAPTEGLLAQTITDGDRATLEAELKELESQIAGYEKTIEGYREQGRTLNNEVKQFTAQIKKLNSQIKAINLTLNNLDQEIKVTGNKIVRTETEIDFHKEIIAKALQGIYESESQNLLEILLENPKLSDFFGNINDLLVVQDNLRISLSTLVSLRDDYLEEKEQLGEERSDVSVLKESQLAQSKLINNLKQAKADLLEKTKGQETNYQTLLKQTKEDAAKIRNRLFELFGGGEMTFAQAYELAKSAERATGVRAALTLAVLDKESALGRNVGQCDYKTVMNPKRDIPVFLELINELGLGKNLEAGLIKVSCPITSDGAFGGAMGPAQFIPSTWNLYKDRIAEVTGNRPPSPWRNIDAFVATALYLKDAYNSAECLNYSREIPDQSVTLRERCAAAKYYAGGRWYRYRWAYGEPVLDRAAKFERDIKVISG